MNTARTFTLLVLLALSSGAHAEVIRYQFTGSVTGLAAGASVQAGDSFAGSWQVDLAQPGLDISAPGFSGRQYDLGALRIDLNGETASVPGGAVFVSESVVDPALAGTWPSGFSSDYVVSAVSPSLMRWNVEAWRFRVVFSYDGLGLWNKLAPPAGFDFLDEPVGAVLLIDVFGGEFGSAGEIRGRIDSLAVAPVPLPSPAGLLALALSGLGIARRFRGRIAAVPNKMPREE